MELIKMDVMKKYTIIAAMAAALLSIGCAKEQTLPDEGTVLKASISTLTFCRILFSFRYFPLCLHISIPCDFPKSAVIITSSVTDRVTVLLDPL